MSEELLAVALIFGLVLLRIASIPSKTNKYRRKLVDLYIAGKVRILAKKESIDLDEEYKVFQKYQKEKFLDEDGARLDEVIEQEVSEEYIDEQDKKQTKK
jgi:hypothetical protein